MGRILCVVLAVALDNSAPDEKALFRKVQRCVQVFIQFQLMVRYESHDDETLSMMDDYLKEFYVTVEVFKQFRSRKVAKKQAAAESLHQVVEAELEAAEISDFTCHEAFLKE